MPVADDQVHLEQIVQLNQIDTRWFLPFLIYRFKEHTDQQVIQFQVTLQGIPQQTSNKRVLELHWKRESETLSSPPIQTSVITEWAAYGMACVVVPFYTGLQIAQVTQIGERFDFWVRKDGEKFGLEVSGTLDGNLEQRQRIKQRQLLRNRNQVGGYVSVTSFQEQHTILSFHRIKDTP